MTEEEKLKKELFTINLRLVPLMHKEDNEKYKKEIENLRTEVNRIKREITKLKLKERGIKK